MPWSSGGDAVWGPRTFWAKIVTNQVSIHKTKGCIWGSQAKKFTQTSGQNVGKQFGRSSGPARCLWLETPRSGGHLAARNQSLGSSTSYAHPQDCTLEIRGCLLFYSALALAAWKQNKQAWRQRDEIMSRQTRLCLCESRTDIVTFVGGLRGAFPMLNAMAVQVILGGSNTKTNFT